MALSTGDGGKKVRPGAVVSGRFLLLAVSPGAERREGGI
jgi:hypothetical protein